MNKVYKNIREKFNKITKIIKNRKTKSKNQRFYIIEKI